jgi:hypothetical protein
MDMTDEMVYPAFLVDPFVGESYVNIRICR